MEGAKVQRHQCYVEKACRVGVQSSWGCDTMLTMGEGYDDMKKKISSVTVKFQRALSWPRDAEK